MVLDSNLDSPIGEEETILHDLFANATTSVLRPFYERAGINMNSRDQSDRTVLLSELSNPTLKEGQHPHLTETDQSKPAYTRPYTHLINSATHGASLEYLAVDNKGSHVIFYLLISWSSETMSQFFSIPGVRPLITQKDNAGYSPLHCALAPSPRRYSYVNDIIDTFINEGGADLLEPDLKSDTALHHLSRNLHSHTPEDCLPYTLMNLFLALGGSITHVTTRGMTPLLLYLAAGRYQSHLP